jgi:hypothetical protein
MPSASPRFDPSLFLRSFGCPNPTYALDCTCKKANPKANPKRVIAQQVAAVVMISPIWFVQVKLIFLDDGSDGLKTVSSPDN